MAQRPNVFSQEQFEESLRRQGCAESFVSPTTSDFRLLVPLAIRQLGEEGIVALLEKARGELSLGEQTDAWKHEAKFIVGWAEEQIDDFKARRQQESSGGFG